MLPVLLQEYEKKKIKQCLYMSFFISLCPFNSRRFIFFPANIIASFLFARVFLRILSVLLLLRLTIIDVALLCPSASWSERYLSSFLKHSLTWPSLPGKRASVAAKLHGPTDTCPSTSTAFQTYVPSVVRTGTQICYSAYRAEDGKKTFLEYNS